MLEEAEWDEEVRALEELEELRLEEETVEEGGGGRKGRGGAEVPLGVEGSGGGV